MGQRMTATVFGAVKGRAQIRAPQAVTSLDRSCAPRPPEVVGAKGATDNFDHASGGSNKGRSLKKELAK
jgi:hypothetical protein